MFSLILVLQASACFCLLLLLTVMSYETVMFDVVGRLLFKIQTFLDLLLIFDLAHSALRQA
jgi:hypothetical protein